MPIFDLYSKRLKQKELSGQEDVFQYSEVSEKLRHQIHYIMNDAIGSYFEADEYNLNGYDSPSNKYWFHIQNTLVREYGSPNLGVDGDPYQQCYYLLFKGSVEEVLDLVDLAFKYIHFKIPKDYSVSTSVMNSEKAIQELNHRFRENSFGYEFLHGELVKVNSKFTHAEIIKPALNLLHTEGFEGASEEFLLAHRFFREGKYKESLNNSLKAFESTMKTICSRNAFDFKEGDSAKRLLEVLFKNEYIPSSMQTHFTGLRATLEAGLPTLRNRNSGHGQGEIKVEVTEEVVHYALNLCATNIFFLSSLRSKKS